jgi:hypothetical protein
MARGCVRLTIRRGFPDPHAWLPSPDLLALNDRYSRAAVLAVIAAQVLLLRCASKDVNRAMG